MIILVLGLVVFIGLHIIPGLRIRAGLIERFGETTYRIGYAVITIVGLVLIVIGYAAARPDADVYYEPPAILRMIGGLLMIPAFILFPAARLNGFIKKTVGHPQTTAIKVWAFAHLLMNGDTASFLLFGAFLAWAVYLRISYTWRDVKIPARLPDKWSRPDTIATLIGLALYAVFVFGAHEFLIGVPAMG